MSAGQSGTVVEVLGGGGLLVRLDTMGIRVGKQVKKSGGIFGRGPVVVQVGGTQAAMGHGMAKQVVVEVADRN